MWLLKLTQNTFSNNPALKIVIVEATRWVAQAKRILQPVNAHSRARRWPATAAEYHRWGCQAESQAALPKF